MNLRKPPRIRVLIWGNHLVLVAFVWIIATEHIPSHVHLALVALALLGGRVAISWGYARHARRVRALTDYAQQIADGKPAARCAIETDDELGALEQALDRLGLETARREHALREESARKDFDARLHRALAVADSEDETLLVLQNALARIAPNGPIQLLLADPSGRKLSSAIGIGSDGGLGCNVANVARCTAMRRGQTMTFHQEALDACTQLAEDRPGLCAATCVPINAAGRIAGVVHLAGTATPDQLKGLDSVAVQAGARLGVLRAMQRTQEQASTDPLTGLLNRRSFEERVHELQRAGTPFVLAMCDLDHFKRLNDSFGHAAGDRALRRFADVARTKLRPTDVVGRFGGEEFVLVLVDTNSAMAAEVLDRLRRALRSTIEEAGEPVFTASFGVVDSCQSDTLPGLLRLADAAMYQAKARGRDRVVVAGGGPAEQPRRGTLPQGSVIRLVHAAVLAIGLLFGTRARAEVLEVTPFAGAQLVQPVGRMPASMADATLPSGMTVGGVGCLHLGMVRLGVLVQTTELEPDATRQLGVDRVYGQLGFDNDFGPWRVVAHFDFGSAWLTDGASSLRGIGGKVGLDLDYQPIRFVSLGAGGAFDLLAFPNQLVGAGGTFVGRLGLHL